MVAIAALALIAAACSEAAPDADAGNNAADGNATTEDTPGEDVAESEADDATSADTADAAVGDSIVERYAGESWFLGEIPVTPVAADDTLEPIRIGMINLEDNPIGSYPELRFAADAAINWINAELGGVEGRPLELHPCITQFSVEQSQACAQELVQEGVVALVGGIDILSQGSLPILEANGIPMVGGIPAGLAEQRSPMSFTFSGGSAGGLAAFMKHAADNGAERAVIAYGEFDAFEVAAADYGAKVGEYLGLEVKLIRFPLTATDFLPVLTQALEFEADAVVVAAAGSPCVSVMQTFRDLEIDGQLYLVGACAAEEIINAAEGANIGVIFNSEGPPDVDDIEGTIFDVVTDEYNAGDAKAAGTVGFRGMMNLYAILVELGADGISSDAIVEALRASVDRESFWGHPYTCDGNQVPGLPSLCAPQQTLFTMEVADEITFVTGWIDTAELFELAGAGS